MEASHVLAPDMGRALLEPIQQPLYSSAVLDGDGVILPRELLFFGYGIGERVSGAGGGAVVNATPWHTNMMIGRQLPSPKTFLIEAVSVAWLEIEPPELAAAAALIDPSIEVAIAGSDALDDLILAWYTGHYTLTIGGLKNYVEVPLILVPCNTGIVGFSAGESSPVATAYMRSEAFHPCGEAYTLDPYPVNIPSLQEFDSRITWYQQNRAEMLADHILVSYLDGRQGREVL